jgi:hypothetical protein
MPIRRVVLVTLAAALLAAPSALAGSPGKWTQLGQANLDNIDEAALTRSPDGVLHVVWTVPSHNSGGAGDSLMHDAIAPNGTPAPVNPITTGWAGITSVPDVVTMPDGTLRAFFGGLHSTDSTDPNLNMNTATAPASGASWTVFPGTVVKGDSAYAGDDGAAVGADGTPFLSFGGTGAGAFVHRGLDPNTPNFPLQSQLGGCCGYSPDVAIDTVTGAPSVAWYSNANDKFGVFTQSLDPGTGQPLGSPALMPGSTTPFNGKPASSQQLTRTPIAARAGGGVFVAYSGGYPTADRVLFWRIGSPAAETVASHKGSGHIVSLAAAPDGRMWVVWIERGSIPRVFAARSNRSAGAFGPVLSAGRPPGGDSAFKIDANAQTGTLDIVALYSTGSSALAQWHTQLLPGLALKASPKKIKGTKATKVNFTVTDPEPVKGAKVKAGGKSATTDNKGHATISLGPTKKKSLAATATKSGYTKGTTKLAIKH